MLKFNDAYIFTHIPHIVRPPHNSAADDLLVAKTEKKMTQTASKAKVLYFVFLAALVLLPTPIDR